MRPRSPAPPLWFQLAGVVLVAALLHVCRLHSVEHNGVQFAFFGWLITAFTWIWNGIQAGTAVTVQFLSWAVTALFGAIATVYNALVEVTGAAMAGLRKGWQFFRDTYDHILKPAWQKFWRLVDVVRDSLERVLGPVIRWLRTIRTWVLDFYDRYVRPVLDAIGVARKVLRVLSTLGLSWARRLDAQLAKLEERINAPFLFALRKLNEVINIVNRVVTANGLFQRLALVRSIERDIRYVSRAFANWRSRPLSEDDYTALRAKMAARSIEEIAKDTKDGYETRTGRYGPLIEEMSVQWRQYFTGR